MGMDIDEYSDRSIALGKGLNTLVGDLYAAIEDEISVDEVAELLKAGRKKIEMYEKLSAETTGGMHEGLKKKYADYIESIRQDSKKVEEKYHDRIC